MPKFKKGDTLEHNSDGNMGWPFDVSHVTVVADSKYDRQYDEEMVEVNTVDRHQSRTLFFVRRFRLCSKGPW